jgi:hypothetical protein
VVVDDMGCFGKLQQKQPRTSNPYHKSSHFPYSAAERAGVGRGGDEECEKRTTGGALYTVPPQAGGLHLR